MCTAATYLTSGFYFGRTLDFEFSYNEQIVITPRNFPLSFRNGKVLDSHPAIIGMACVIDNTPLFFDAMNEKGLCMAGLNFVGNACYHEEKDGYDNIPNFEFIPWILGQCENLVQAKELLARLNITNESFGQNMPLSRLHWIISDRTGSVTVESVAEGLMVYDNPVGVLANNPPFPMQMFQLNNYMSLSNKPPENRFAPSVAMDIYSRGMGALGLPGDLSSQSRFVRAAFVKMNSVSAAGEEESVSQFFHILGAVEQQRGCCELDNGDLVTTIYTSCCSADKGIYYYVCYDNHQINAVDMNRVDLNGAELSTYALRRTEQVYYHN